MADSWDRVDTYIGEKLIGDDAILAAALAHNAENGLQMCIRDRAMAATAPSSVVDYFISAAPAAAVQLLFAVLVIFFFLAGWTRLRRSTIRRRGSFDGAMQTARVIQNVVDATADYLATITMINAILGLTVSLLPVSYTHLDVDKRQAAGCAAAGTSCAGGTPASDGSAATWDASSEASARPARTGTTTIPTGRPWRFTSSRALG